MGRFEKTFFPEVQFGGFTDADGAVAFYNRVNALIDREAVVLDYGCGRGQYLEDPVIFRRNLRTLKGKAARVIGADVDVVGESNPSIDEFHLIKDDRVATLADNSVDLIVCDCVIEHLPSPSSFFRESRRLLKPNTGILCIRTPNVASYVGIASRMIPNRMHSKVLSRVQDGRKQEDVFPTVYRCNTIRAVRKAMNGAGFDAVVLGYEAEPAYLEFSFVAYSGGVLHRKLMPRLIAPVIHAFGRKQ